jgi:leader peptidase (prepilin peptidase) / N-methyltransferase
MSVESIAWLLSPLFLCLVGLAIGSFLNVVIHRKPIMLERQWLGDAAQFLQDEPTLRRVLGDEGKALPQLAAVGQTLEKALSALPALTLSGPPSRCPACAHAIAWHENIPVLGWLRLRGRCSACGARIAVRYPLVEAFTAALFFAVASKFGPSAATVVYCVAAAILVAAALIDLDTTLLPDDLTLPVIGLGIVAAWQRWTPVTLADAALGALFGYFTLWAVARIYRAVRHVDGMAEGDFKLLSGLGALLGWQALPSIILLSSAVGAVVGIYMIAAKGHQRSVPIPFGPYLAGGGLAALFFGTALSRWWFPA